MYDERRPSFRLLPPGAHAGVARLDEKGSDRTVELREDDRQLGDAAVRDVALLAVEDVLVAVPVGRGLDAGDVGAGAWLGERDRGEAALLRGEPRQPALLLLLRAGAHQRPHGEHRRPDRRGKAGAAPRELLGDQTRRHCRHAAAAVLGRDRVRGQPERRRLREQLGRAVLALVPLPCDRAQLALGEVVREVPQLPLLGRELETDPLSHAYVQAHPPGPLAAPFRDLRAMSVRESGCSSCARKQTARRHRSPGGRHR